MESDHVGQKKEHKSLLIVCHKNYDPNEIITASWLKSRIISRLADYFSFT